MAQAHVTRKRTRPADVARSADRTGHGLEGVRLAKQAPDGAVAIETGTVPAPETPEKTAGTKRSLGTLGTLNIVVRIALIAVNGVLAQLDDSQPAKRRVLRRS